MYKEGEKPRPPCERCGADKNVKEIDLTDHHIFPKEYNWENMIRKKVFCLCRDCHDDIHALINYHERQHGETNSRNQLPKWWYPFLALLFITN